ncbi:MAG: IPTL-CTERM sorting domain-containing protein [Phycisphaerales bacterium]|nr:MAG: IPTL-CTERM sorting domain-containing protein [Phycisphaerales bacterium]
MRAAMRVPVAVSCALAVLNITPRVWAAGECISFGRSYLHTDHAEIVFGTGDNAIPLGSGFFGDESDAVVECNGESPCVVPLEADSFEWPSTADSLVDYVVDDEICRYAPDSCDPDPEGIPIKLTKLSLKSSNPLSVTWNGGQNPTPFDIHVGVSSNQESLGTIWICTDADGKGGTFSSSWRVHAVVEFRQTDNPENVIILDTGLPETFHAVIMESVSDGQWSYEPEEGLFPDPCNQSAANCFNVVRAAHRNWHYDWCHESVAPALEVEEYDECPLDPDKILPGVCGCGIPDDDSDGDDYPDCVDCAPGVDDDIYCPCPYPCLSPSADGIPTVSEWGLVVLALLLMIVGKVYFGRRRWVAQA